MEVIFVVERGQRFSLLANANDIEWASKDDPVLALLVDGNNADVEAMQAGSSTIFIMDKNDVILEKIKIKVTSNEAKTSGIKIGNPIPKKL